jgi:hypothetical protein
VLMSHHPCTPTEPPPRGSVSYVETQQIFDAGNLFGPFFGVYSMPFPAKS